MPKIKKEPYENSKKKNLFFYEIIGIVLAVLSFFALSKLGKFGLYLFLIVKLLFGDWGFLFIIIGILAGCYFLMVHDHLPISSLRIIGIFFIFLSLLILSHFSMHNYVSQYSTDYLSLTLSLYIDYFKSANSDSITGGGIIGMLCFYLFYHLLSIPGVIIISLLLIVLGVSFVSKKTLNEFIKILIKVFRFILNKLKIILLKSKKFVKNINKEYNNGLIKKLPRNFVKKINLNPETNSNLGDSLLKEVKVILNRFNLYHYEVDYYLTPHLIVIRIKYLMKIDYYKLETELSKCITVPYLLKVNEDDQVIMLEFSKDYIQKISLFEAINKDNNDILFLGINDHNEIECLNEENSSVLMFIKEPRHFYFYILLGVLNKFTVRLYDFNNDLKIFENYLLYENNPDKINNLIVEIENKDTEDLELCFINLSSKKSNKELISKIRYLIELSKELPFYFIVRLDDFIIDNHYFYDSFSYLMTIDVNNLSVLKLFGFYQSTGLKLGEEGLIKNLNVVMRLAVGGVSEEEMKKIELKE